MSAPERLARNVRKLIDKYGTRMVLTKRSPPGGYDPTTGTGTTAPATHDVRGLSESDSSQGSGKDGMRPDTTVRQSRRKVTMGAPDPAATVKFKPEAGDIIGPIDGMNWTVSGDPEFLELEGIVIAFIIRVTA